MTTQTPNTPQRSVSASGSDDRRLTVPAPGLLANVPNSERPEVQIGTAFAGGLLVALILKRLVG